MNMQPNRGPMPLRFMFAPILAILPILILAIILWDDQRGVAVICAIVAMAVIVGNYYVRSRAWREGILPVRRN